MRARIARICLGMCFVICAAWADEKSPAENRDAKTSIRLVVDLTDGSRVVGTLENDRLKVLTNYADFDLSLSRVSTLEFDPAQDGSAEIRLENGDALKVRFPMKELALNTTFGNVALPIAMMRGIRTAGAGDMSLPEGLVLYFPFATKDKNGAVNDQSGSGNNGTVRDGTYIAEGRSGRGAMQFVGDTGGVGVKIADTFKTQDLTIMAWVRVASAQDKEIINGPAKNSGGVFFGWGHGGYAMGVVNGQLYLTKVGTSNVHSQQLLPQDQWHHVAVTKRGSNVVFYMDGTPEQPVNYDAQFEFTTDLAAGARGDSGSGFSGWMNELMVFKRALSPEEIKRVYDSKK